MTAVSLADPLRPVESEVYLGQLLTPTTRRHLLGEALIQVEPPQFSDSMLGALWQAARDLRDADTPITARTLVGRLRDALPHRPTERDHNSVQRAQRWLDAQAGQVPDAGEFPHHLSTVVRCGQLRRLIEGLDRIRHQALDEGDPSRALAMAYEELGGLDRAVTDDEHVHEFADLLDRFVEEQRNPDPALVIPTPWRELNEILNGGLRAGRMYVEGGRPGDGKSIGLLQLSQFAAELGYHSLVFSAEMGAPEVTDRFVSSGAVVEQSHITGHRLDDADWTRVGEYYNRARELPITVVDKPNLTLPYIKATARAAKRKHGTRVLAVDYLQLVGGDSRGHQREQEVAAISRGLKQLARELDVVVLVAAQLNREGVRAGRRPQSSDLRESGGIEADADVIFLHHRPLIEEGDLKGQPGYTVTLYVDKNRVGRTGFVELDWRAHYATLGSRPQLLTPEMGR